VLALTSWATTKGTFLFDSDSGQVSFDRDGTGAAAPTLVASFTNVSTLDVDDFRFI
jgi:hypothetical protein